MSERPWYKRYGADFVHGTLGLTLEQKGAYSIVLDLIYDRGGPIPNDARWLAGVCGCSVRKWKAILAQLVDANKLIVSGELISNFRAEKEIEKAAKDARKLAENGAKGGRKRAENKPDTKENKDLDEAGLKHRARDQKPEARSKDSLSNAHAHEFGSFIPSDWEPNARDLMEAGKYFDDKRIALEVEKFRDHYQTVPGERGRSRDWSIEWRKWIRRAVEFDGQNAKRTKRNGTSPADARATPLREATREFLADNHARRGGIPVEPVAEPFPDTPPERRLARAGGGLQPVALSIPKIESAGGD